MTTPADCSAEEREYRRLIDECAAGKIDQLLSNSLPAHACYLMTKMLTHAEKRVCLSSGTLSCYGDADTVTPAPVYASDELLGAAEKFLEKEGAKFDVLLQFGEVDGGLDSHPLVRRVRTMKNEGRLRGTFDLRHMPAADSDVELHFMVADDTAYRSEVSHKPFKAHANFNDPKIAGMHVAFFDQAFPHAVKLETVSPA